MCFALGCAAGDGVGEGGADTSAEAWPEGPGAGVGDGADDVSLPSDKTSSFATVASREGAVSVKETTGFPPVDGSSFMFMLTSSSEAMSGVLSAAGVDGTESSLAASPEAAEAAAVAVVKSPRDFSCVVMLPVLRSTMVG